MPDPLALAAPPVLRAAAPAITRPVVEGTTEALAPRLAGHDRATRRLLALADFTAALFALTFAVVLLGDDRISAGLILGLPLVVLMGKLQGLYDRDELLIRKSTADEMPQLFQLATIYALVITILSPQVIQGALGPMQIAGLWASLFGFTVANRLLARRAAHKSAPLERCVFIGDAGAYARLCTKLEDHKVQMVGRMSMQRIALRGARTASSQELRDLFAFTNADRVIIEPQTLPAEDMHDLVRAAKSAGIKVSLLPRVLDVVGSSVVMDEIEGMTILGVRRFGLPKSSMLMKRGFDLGCSVVGLLAVAPLLAVIAVAIKLDSRGPILFRQERVGRDGMRFRICKFRTMGVDAEARKAALREVNECDGGLFKIADDPRVTRVGRLLRRTSLDELPQLLNVVRGDMSLVGPRPLVLDEDERITGMDRSRLALTPGMTGHWQILGSARVPMPEMLKIDYLYVAGWSLWSDVKILIRTVPYMLARRGM